MPCVIICSLIHTCTHTQTHIFPLWLIMFVSRFKKKKKPTLPQDFKNTQMLPSKIAIILCFSFRSIIHLELIFVHGVHIGGQD